MQRRAPWNAITLGGGVAVLALSLAGCDEAGDQAGLIPTVERGSCVDCHTSESTLRATAEPPGEQPPDSGEG